MKITNKTFIILRGCSSSGKTTFAEFLIHLYPDAIACTADDYMVDENNNYDFKPEKLGYVHKKCYEKFLEAVAQQKKLIILANTNTDPKHFNKYIDTAEFNGYKIVSLVLEKRHSGKQQHSVPDITLIRQRDCLLSSLKLI